MQNTQTPSASERIIADAYAEHYATLVQFIARRIAHKYEAEDLVQDAFVRLLDYQQMLRPDTVKYFLFTIARNLVIDNIRRHYKRQEATAYLYDTQTVYCNETESSVVANDLAQAEIMRVHAMPAQRRAIYTLARYDETPSGEIAQQLSLSKRTVENHLLLARREMREYMRHIG